MFCKTHRTAELHDKVRLRPAPTAEPQEVKGWWIRDSRRASSVPDHDEPVGNDVGNSEIERGKGRLCHHVFQDQDSLHEHLRSAHSSSVTASPFATGKADSSADASQRQTQGYARTTLPASPPAISAKPRNSTSRAFHATPVPL